MPSLFYKDIFLPCLIGLATLIFPDRRKALFLHLCIKRHAHMKKLFRLLIVFIVLQSTLILNAEAITNPSRSDGFGAQFQTIIYSAIYAELRNKKFNYTPFKSMEHNYNNDSDFIKNKEELINFIGNFEIKTIANCRTVSIHEVISFFEGHLNTCANSQSLVKIKKIFRANKDREKFFNTEDFNIAVHVRRPNLHDNRIAGTDLEDSIYLKIIDSLRHVYSSRNPRFHIYSQGDSESIKAIYGAADVICHINTPIEDTFTSMVLADVLVTTSSSFSYTAGILSNGIVYYIPFWHPPLPHWIVFRI
jgi:hypothetical protein